VVSDPALGISDVFGSSVVTYREQEELAEIYRNPDAYFPGGSVDAQRIRTEHDVRARARTLIAAAESARHE
jgi:hypothetical protein